MPARAPAPAPPAAGPAGANCRCWWRRRRATPGGVIVLVNRGEHANTVRRCLEAGALRASHVPLDRLPTARPASAKLASSGPGSSMDTTTDQRAATAACARGPVVIDVRSERGFDAAAIADAVNVPRPQLGDADVTNAGALYVAAARLQREVR